MEHAIRPGVRLSKSIQIDRMAAAAPAAHFQGLHGKNRIGRNLTRIQLLNINVHCFNSIESLVGSIFLPILAKTWLGSGGSGSTLTIDPGPGLVPLKYIQTLEAATAADLKRGVVWGRSPPGKILNLCAAA